MGSEMCIRDRSTAIVIYTIIADTLFFVFTFPVLWILMGRIFFLPAADLPSSWQGIGTTLIVVWFIMASYGVLLLYGLFVKPIHIKRLLNWIANRSFLSKSKTRISKAADDIEVSSKHIRDLAWHFHAKLALATLVAWILRFFTVTAILIALNPSMAQSVSYTHLTLPTIYSV